MYGAGGRRRTSPKQPPKPTSVTSRNALGNGAADGFGTETTQTEPPPNTDSARQRIVNEVENLKNQKADTGITVGHEVETKKHSYVIVREIIKGRMSRVFEVRRNKDNKVLAMKAHLPNDNGKPTLLRHEAHIYHELSVLSKNLAKEDIRFLSIYDYGECSEGQFLFLTLGGESLASILSDEKVPNYQTALDLSLQMLNVIEQVHRLGFIHCRIRPHTFVTGTKPRERYTLFLINFALARMANPTRSETVISRTPPQIFDRYAPRCQHNGAPYNRRDDLESWYYMCCDLFHPMFLPWSTEKRLKSAQMADLKDKLMKGDLYYRYSVMPKPFQAIAGAINETDAKMPNYAFFKECIMEEAKAKNCTFNSPWDFRPTADLPPVPELQNQTRIDFEFNRCVQNPAAFNFGTEKSRTVLPDDAKDVKDLSESSSSIQIVLPNAAKKQLKPQSPAASKPSKNESIIVSMSDVVKAAVEAPPLSAIKPKDGSKEKASVSTEASSDENEEEEEFKLKSPPPSSRSQTIRGVSQAYHPPPLRSSSSSTNLSSSSTPGLSPRAGSPNRIARSPQRRISAFSSTTDEAATTSGSSTTSSASGFSETPGSLSSLLRRHNQVIRTPSPRNNSQERRLKPESSSTASTPSKTSNSSVDVAAAPSVNGSKPTSECSTASLPSQAKATVATADCSTASLPQYAKQPQDQGNNNTPKTSVLFNPQSPPAFSPSINNYPKPASSQAQQHKNDSVYFGIPTNPSMPKNASTFLKPSTQESSKTNQSAYFMPK